MQKLTATKNAKKTRTVFLSHTVFVWLVWRMFVMLGKHCIFFMENITKTHTKDLFKQNPKANSGKFSICFPKGRIRRNLGGSVGRWDTGVVGGVFFLSCSSSNTLVFFLPSPTSWRLLVRSEYPSLVQGQHSTPPEDFGRRIQGPPRLIAQNRWYLYPELQP